MLLGVGVNDTDVVSPWNICSFGNSAQKGHPESTLTPVDPTTLELVRTYYLVGLVVHTATGGFGHVSKFPNY